MRGAIRGGYGPPVLARCATEGILLRPQKLVDATQAWFWTAGWQAGERDGPRFGSTPHLGPTRKPPGLVSLKAPTPSARW